MAESADKRVLLVCPFGRDADLIRKVLEQSGIQSAPYKDVASACQAFRFENVGALMIAEEALGKETIAVLAAALAEQPAWSDLPVLVLTSGPKQTVDSRQQRLDYLPLGKITLLERPMQIATLVSSVKAALRARSLQYERRSAEEALQKTEKLAVLGRLASTIAHEINNPLEAVMNLLHLLRESPLSSQQQEYVEIAQQELARVAEIAGHTLTFNRQSNKTAQASVSALLDSVLALYQSRLAGSQVTIERRFQKTGPILCYPGELRQVFANLIGNAFDATRNGGRIILRERAAAHPKTGKRGIRITVADTGQGMTAEVKAHLFEAFYSTKEFQGTGLGLWISKGIIEKHRGVIRFRSSPKQGKSGTVFSVFIPTDGSAMLETSRAPVLQATGSD